MFKEHFYSECERNDYQAKVEQAAKEQKEREERIQQKIADRKMPSYEDLVEVLAYLVGEDGLYENVCAWETEEAKRIYRAAAELVPQWVWLLHDGWENTLFGRRYRCKIMDISRWSLQRYYLDATLVDSSTTYTTKLPPMRAKLHVSEYAIAKLWQTAEQEHLGTG